MPKAEGGPRRTSLALPPHLLRHRGDPPLSLRDISPRLAGGDQSVQGTVHCCLEQVPAYEGPCKTLPPFGGRCRRQRGVWDGLRSLPPHPLGHRVDPLCHCVTSPPAWRGEIRVFREQALVVWNGSLRAETFAKLSPFWGEMPKAEGGPGRTSLALPPHLLRHRGDPPLSLRDISPRLAGGEQSVQGTVHCCLEQVPAYAGKRHDRVSPRTALRWLGRWRR